MKYSVITSFNKKYWDEVGHQTIKKLDENWHESGNIYLYHELDDSFVNTIKKGFSSRVQWIDLYPSVPYLSEFIDKFKDHPKANGQAAGWRSHAIKWVHKTFPLLQQVRKETSGWLCWLDVDAECFKKIDNDYVKTICNPSKMLSYLGRKGNYSECGFLGFNIDHPKLKDFVDAWWNIYPTGNFTKVSETHDSFLFDAVRKDFGHPELFDDLNAHSTTNKNPFGNSKLGSHFIHAKGSNKSATLQKITRRK